MRADFLFPKLDPSIPIADINLENLTVLLDEEVVREFIKKERTQITHDKMWQFARANFKNDDETPWEMSPGELAIYRLIVLREHPRSQIIASTQYGKTMTIARALLTRITTFPEEWMLLVPDTKRGKIVLHYMIRDTANNEYFTQKLTGVKTDDNLLMHLLEERSKAKLTYQILENDSIPRYGSIELLTTDARRKQNAINYIMGFGGRDIICLPFWEKILTNKGYLPIGKIVEEKMDVEVCSFNHSTQKVEFSGIDKYEKNDGGDLIEIDLGDRKITCTEDHPIWVERRGYVKASQVQRGDQCWVFG